MIWLLLLACGTEEVQDTGLVGPEPMEPGAALARLSLDLRGVRPSTEELAAVRADPTLLDSYAAAYVDDPRFGERLVDWYATVYKTTADRFIPGIDHTAAIWDPIDRVHFARGLGEEPLRVIARVGTQDLPFTEAVVGDWTVVNDTVLDVADNIELSEEDTGGDWHLAYYTDLRPPTGVLATNGMWWRYTSTAHNFNRGRAAAVVTTLLCEERFDQPVVFANDLEDLSSLDKLVEQEPACVACHVVIDPIGAYLYGFYRKHTESGTEAMYYFPEREDYWTRDLDIPPSYYGSSEDENLADLGRRIADDPRFVSCAVEHAWGFLHDQSPEIEQLEELSEHREAFIDDGLTLGALYTSIATRDNYLSQDESDGQDTVPPKRLSPKQMASVVEQFTGYDWSHEGLDMMTNDEYGMRVLAGGMDGAIVTEPASDHSVTQLLVMQRLAELGSAKVVTDELALPASERTLFTEVADLEAEPTAAELEAQLQRLMLLMLGQEVASGDAELEALAQLHGALSEQDGSAEAWRGIVSALLRHPDFVQY